MTQHNADSNVVRKIYCSILQNEKNVYHRFTLNLNMNGFCLVESFNENVFNIRYLQINFSNEHFFNNLNDNFKPTDSMPEVTSQDAYIYVKIMHGECYRTTQKCFNCDSVYNQKTTKLTSKSEDELYFNFQCFKVTQQHICF